MSRKTFQTNEFLYGVCYYPEHWDEALWDEDFRRIKEMGMNVVRMGEGAWNIWEPEEGRYSFELFDRALELCAAHGLKVIMGTPTYAPPAWLTEKYPEVLRADYHGHLMQHGSRRHYNYTSPVYRKLSAAIVTAMASHYGNHPQVIGWQIDNEFNCHMSVSYAESDHTSFREWLQEKYETLGALNQAWGTAFWAQTYTDWSQVYLPRPTPTYHNPGHLLDMFRFISDSVVAFARLQTDILREQAPRQFITHNGLFGNIDNDRLTRETLDFMSYDSYPAFSLWNKDAPPHFRDRSVSGNLSKVRGMSGKFMILEQQAGPGGQSGMLLGNRKSYLHATPKPGQMRLWAWQSIAHGADGLLFFRFRTCTVGAETLWHGLNHYGNQPHRRLEEAKYLGEELGQTGPLLLSSTVESPVAIVYDYDNDSNNQIDEYLGQSEWAMQGNIFRGLTELHYGVDLVDARFLEEEEGAERYKLLFYPNAQLLEKQDTDRLETFVRQGGTLVLGPRTGYKDRFNRCHMLPFPGTAQELAGLEVTDFTMVDEAEPSAIRWIGGVEGEEEEEVEKDACAAPVFNEILKPEHPGAQTLACYTADYYAGEPALVSVPLGLGQVVYAGFFLTAAHIAPLMRRLGFASPLLGWASVPKEVECVTRTCRDGSGRKLHIFLNYTAVSRNLQFHGTVEDVVRQTSCTGEVTLEPYGVLLIRR
ncbi:MAG: beta-galactosidase [Paenibacillaceae bacterium]|jgi:beta-galactosidase|nr:beta-galactosidase [Paenibacillaceae bacterium]